MDNSHNITEEMKAHAEYVDACAAAWAKCRYEFTLLGNEFNAAISELREMFKKNQLRGATLIDLERDVLERFSVMSQSVRENCECDEAEALNTYRDRLMALRRAANAESEAAQ
jgi:hypothetical protein